MSREIEAKLKVEDHDMVRRRLIAVGRPVRAASWRPIGSSTRPTADCAAASADCGFAVVAANRDKLRNPR
jgi:hypothetical protein